MTPAVTADPDRNPTVERIAQERDLYRRILELGAGDDVEVFLEEVLELVVDMTGAARGYIELYGPEGAEGEASWSISRGCTSDEVSEIREIISRGIVAAALESGRTIITPSAVLDPRFRERASVRGGSIEAVMCAPVGLGGPIGVVYLQSRNGASPFDEGDRSRLELFARHLAPLCDRLLVRSRLASTEDPTRPWRTKLRADGLVGRSRALAETLREAAAAAPLRDVTVLLTGESGTGKTHLARVLHDNGPRATSPFVAINAAAIPEGLVESELFGAVAGAHSGATRAMPGKIAAAQGGTLFLDEVGELPLASQAKLLQLLHSREYAPLGSVRMQRADIRIIAATNGDLSAAVREGRFRQDLFFRLDVLRIRMPSLSERREDIPLLAEALADACCRRNGLAPIRLSAAAIAAAETAEWPGNVRQLGNAVERALVRASAEGLSTAEHRHLFDAPAGAPHASGDQLSWQEATRRFQRELLLRTLTDVGGNVSETARRLDLVRSHVYTLLKGYGLLGDESEKTVLKPEPKPSAKR